MRKTKKKDAKGCPQPPEISPAADAIAELRRTIDAAGRPGQKVVRSILAEDGLYSNVGVVIEGDLVKMTRKQAVAKFVRAFRTTCLKCV